MRDENGLYHDYHQITCPICGGKIKHPYTGSVNSEQLEEDLRTCLWMEVVDEGKGTVGYRPMCRYVNEVKAVDLVVEE